MLAKEPLRVLASNPRHFADGSGKAIYLTGTHNWHNFENNGRRRWEAGEPPPAPDSEGYLDLLVTQWAIGPAKPARGRGSTTFPGPAALYLKSVG